MIINNIDTKDISVVVQGATNNKIIFIVLKSIRENLPGATIILSTWEGSNVDNLDFDEVLLNKDPGGQNGARGIGKDNTNRQITSTINGLKKVKTKYAMKLRTDFMLIGNNFLNLFGKFDKYSKNKKYKLFNNRILTSSSVSYPFWFYDFVFFGETNDLIKLFDIPLRMQEEVDWFLNHEPINKQHLKESFRYFAELHIFLNCIAKNVPDIFEKFRDHTDYTDENKALSDEIFIDSFLPIGMTDGMSVATLKGELAELNRITFDPSYLTIYKKYCDKDFVIPQSKKHFYKMFDLKKNKLPSVVLLEENRAKLNSHIKKLSKVKFSIRWLREPFSASFYLLKVIILKFLVFFKQYDRK